MTPPPAVRDDPLWQVGVSLMSGGSLCKVGVVEFPAGINSKLLFVIVTMLNTIHDTLMPAENCTGSNKRWDSIGRSCEIQSQQYLLIYDRCPRSPHYPPRAPEFEHKYRLKKTQI